jgi:glycoside/pentoside/hexuronide:cation symporter, GPH family
LSEPNPVESTHNASLRTNGFVQYALPVIASTMLVIPLGTMVPGIYAKFFNLPLTTLAGLLLLVRVLDSCSDVAIGIWSDQWRSRGGTRKPFIVVGATALALASILVAIPVAGYEGVWFTLTALLTLLGWSAFEIPHCAWGFDLTPQSAQRSRVFGYRAVAYYLAATLTFMIPLLPFQPSREMTPQTLLHIGVIGSLVFAVTLPGLLRLPRGTATTGQPAGTRVSDVLRAITTCGPLRVFLTAYFLTAFGAAMFGGTLFIFVDAYLGLASKVALVFALSSPVGIIAAPVWARIASRIGKKATWFISTAGLGIVLLASGFIEPGRNALLGISMITAILYTLSASMATVAPALLGDIADYGRWKFKQDLGGTYYAAFNLVVKLVASVGAAGGLAVAGAMGVTGHAASNSNAAALGMKLSLAWLPALFVVGALPFIARLPLTLARLALIQQRVTRRSQAGATAKVIILETGA